MNARGPAARPRWLVALAAFVALSLPAAAQTGPTYAIQGARIVPVSGPVIEKGNIVMRGGLIVAVGANVPIPAGAIIIDGAGLHVYPGLVDAHTHYGVPRRQAPQAQQQAAALPAGIPAQLAAQLGLGQQQPSASRVWEPDTTNDPGIYLSPAARGIAPETVVAREFEPESERLAMLGVGVTTALAAPRDGILRGQSAVVSLGEGAPGLLVVRTPAAMHASLAAGGGFGAGYPNSQLGAIAALRQALVDAQWYAERKAQWERRNGAGVPRPPYSAASEALAEVVAGRMPVIFSVTRANDILKVLRIAEEFKLRAVVETNGEAARVAAELKRAGVPVILSLNFRPPPGGGGGFGGGGFGLGQQEPDPAEQREREQQFVRAAAELAKAGVPVAFSSTGLSNYAEFLVNARRAAESLGKDAALEALTLRAAELLGVANHTGSIAAGKAANLIVTTGHPLDPGTRLSYVFTDGLPASFRTPEPPRPQPMQRPGGGQRPPQTETPAGETSGHGAAEPASAPAGQAPAGEERPREIFIHNATLLTLTQGTISNGSIHIRDGKIVAVGRNLRPPQGALVIDGAGKYVMPGIIDMHSHAGIDGGVNEGSLSVTAQTRILDVIDPENIAFYRALAGGVTTLHLLHGSANTIGGQDAILRLKWGRSRDEMLFPGAGLGIKFALGENVKRSNTTQQTARRRYPNTRMGVENVLRESFTQARQYMAEWEAYEKAKAAGGDPPVPRRNLTLETLAGVLKGEVRVHAHCYRSDEIAMLIRIADEFGFKVRSFEHGLEAYKLAPEIARHGGGVSTFADNWAYKIEAYDATPYNMAILLSKGIPVAINSDSNERVRRLYQEAAKAVKYGGVSETEALKTITLYPAMMLDIAHRVGSIEAGKDADLAIFSGHPFDPASHVVMTLVEGEIFFDRAKDLADRGKQTALRRASDDPGYSCMDEFHDHLDIEDYLERNR